MSFKHIRFASVSLSTGNICKPILLYVNYFKVMHLEKNKQTNIPSMENIKHVYAKQTYSKPSIHELRPIPSSDRTNFMNIPLFHDNAKWVHPLPPLGIMPVKITKFLRRNSHAGENDMSTPVLLTTEFVSRCKIPFLHQRY